MSDINPVKQDKIIKKSDLLKVFLRIFPNHYMNSKKTNIGNIETIVKGQIPIDSISPVNNFLYNIFEYANDKDRDKKDIEDYFPHYDTNIPVTPIEYKSKDEYDIEKKEREEKYKEFEELFNNLDIIKEQFNELGKKEDNKKDMEELNNITEDIQKKLLVIDSKNITNNEKEKEKRKELSLYYKSIYQLLKEMNEKSFDQTSQLKQTKVGGKTNKKKKNKNKTKKNKRKNQIKIKKTKKTKKTKN
jgi:hypothetical protein